MENFLDRVVMVSGGYDPLHSGHIAMFKAARALGDLLVVALNSDDWLTRKKGRPFMTWDERASIISELEVVDCVIAFDDKDGTACDAIRKAMDRWKLSEIVFANGGDRSKDNIPEMTLHHPRLSFEFGVGGENKKNSSSWILDNWRTQKTERPWGYWRVLDDKITVKVKELVINPGCSLSDQKHQYRTEHWYILKGNCVIKTEWNNLPNTINLNVNDHYVIEKNVWHLTTNTGTEPCHVLEVQYGEKCIEEDIERRDQ
jgi:cytidyltransferase-like protein